ncbi:ATP-binding cassette domain-containing protein [Ruania albidiflava]|uniref:ATP-binding cassette domain-containing protein n=1 Tax=Ruania albidiflava TaxID=366586 RepID=UPI0023F2F1A1|nr:ABC transporter ATP-binding protein [Ruania albidiflava]
MTTPTTSPPEVRLRQVTASYGSTTALDTVDVTFPAGAITGLLGRNGSGKTTMLSLVASLRRPAAGQVLVDGQDPFEDEALMEQVCLIRESGDVLDDEKVAVNLRYAADSRPTWDAELAGRVLETFQIEEQKIVRRLSRGQRSAFGTVLGLASRAPVTMLDEVYLGMDAPSRYAFYDLLLEDYLAHPRTIILSSHLIVEIENLLEHVVILDRGRVLVAEEAEDLRTQGLQVTGRGADLDALLPTLAGVTVLATRTLGPTRQATLTGQPELLRAAESELRAAGMEIGGIDLQDLFVHLTGRAA